MSSKTIVVIAMMGALGALAFAMIAMFGVQKLADNPMVRARVEVAEKHKVREVTFRFDQPDASTRTFLVGYETDVLAPSMEAQTAEMEAVAQFALEKVREAEAKEDDRIKQKALEKREKPQLPVRGAVTKVVVKRSWRRDRGCLRRSEDSTHEWTPPPPARQ